MHGMGKGNWLKRLLRLQLASSVILLITVQEIKAQQATSLPAFVPQPGPVVMEEPRRRSLFHVAGESLFGDARAQPSTWRLLPLRMFFTEGWNEAWVDSPKSSGGVPRFGWINAFDGVMFRVWFLAFAYANNFNDNGNEYLGSYSIYTPLNRRFEFRFDLPFIVSNKGGESHSYHGNWGDTVISSRFLLAESQDLSQILALDIRTPTGSLSNGNGISSLTAEYEFWYNFTGRWALRGGTGVTVPTNHVGGRTLYFTNLSIGRYLTDQSDKPFSGLFGYLSSNFNTTLDNRSPNRTFLGLTPGIRCYLGNSWVFLTGVEVPVTGPKLYDYKPIFLLLKVY